MVITREINLRTKGNTDVIDITPELRKIISEEPLKDGSCLVFVVGSTASVTTIEYEPGLKKDIKDVLDRLIPPDKSYSHHETWGDDNGHSHLRASIMGPSVTIPFVSKRLSLGTWQQVVFIDFDTRPRERTIVVQLSGE